MENTFLGICPFYLLSDFLVKEQAVVVYFTVWICVLSLGVVTHDAQILFQPAWCSFSEKLLYFSRCIYFHSFVFSLPLFSSPLRFFSFHSFLSPN